MRKAASSPFFTGVWIGAQPLLLWAAHFAACYGAVAVGCTALQQHPPPVAPTVFAASLVGLTVVAAALAGWWLLRACRALPHARGDLMPRVRLIATFLALIGIVWTGIPLLMLPLCEAH